MQLAGDTVSPTPAASAGPSYWISSFSPVTVADSPASSSGAITVVVAVSFVRSQVQRTVKLRVSPSGWLTISASATAPVRAAIPLLHRLRLSRILLPAAAQQQA